MVRVCKRLFLFLCSVFFWYRICAITSLEAHQPKILFFSNKRIIPFQAYRNSIAAKRARGTDDLEKLAQKNVMQNNMLKPGAKAVTIVDSTRYFDFGNGLAMAVYALLKG